MAGALLSAAAMAAFNAGAPIVVSNVLASATTAFVVNAAIATGASYALSVATRPPLQKASDGQVEVKQPLPPLRVVYGRKKLSGSLGFAGRSADAFPVFARTVILAGHEIDAIEAHYLYGFPMTVDPLTGVVTSAFGPLDGNFFVQIIPHLGTTTQAADADLQLWLPTQWTAAHRLRGIAYAALLCFNPTSAEDIQKIFPQGPPEYQALLRGKKLYDPTKDSTNGGSGSHRWDDPATREWSEEQRLIMLDFLLEPLCYGMDFASIDWASWLPQIERGREPVVLKAGGSEPRYRAALEYYPALEDPTDAFNKIRAVGDARVFFTSEGKIGCRGGAWDAPSVALDAHEAAISAEFGRPDVTDSYNVLKFKFLSPAHGYIEQPGDPWRDEAAILADGEEREKEVDFTCCPSHAQGRRLCKIATARDNPAWQGSAVSKLHALPAIGEDAIDLGFAELDGGSGDFDGAYWIDGEITADLANEIVTLPLKAADPASYDWDAASEEGTPPRVPGEPLIPVADILLDDLGNPLLDDAATDVVMSEAA